MSVEAGKLYSIKLKDKEEKIFYCLVLLEIWKIGLKDPNFPAGGEWMISVSPSEIESAKEVLTIEEVPENLRRKIKPFLSSTIVIK